MLSEALQHYQQHAGCKPSWHQTQTPTLACRETAGLCARFDCRKVKIHALVDEEGDIRASGADVGSSRSNRTFILAVDDSPDSEYAVHWAAQQLHRAGDSFNLVHCVPGFPSGQLVAVPGAGLLRMPRVDPALVAEKALAEADNHLANKFRNTLEAAGVQGSFQVLIGPAAAAAAAAASSGSHTKASISSRLCATAAAEGAAAVVIASTSKGGLQEALYGSVAANLVHHCEVPVIVLHRPTESSSSSSKAQQALKGAEVQWLLSATAGGLTGKTTAAAAAVDDSHDTQQQNKEGETATASGRSVVVAVDDSDEGYAAVAWVIQHLWRPGDVLHVLHVVPALPAYMSYSLAPDGMMYSLPLPQLEEAQVEESHWRAMLLQRLGPLLDQHHVDFQLDVITDYGADPVQGIAGTVVVTAERLGAAALVLSGHSRGTVADWLMGSVSDFAAHHAGVPVVVLHGPQFARG